MIKTEKYINNNFMLTNELARSLYYNYAENLPIIDFHNHLDPIEIAANVRPENLSRLWVMNDQYKHRAMRINGIPEYGITGNASDYDKYLNWAKTLPMTLGNPLYQWSYLEMQRIFDIDTILNNSSAKEIWEQCNKKIDSGDISIVSLLRKFNVETLCTSDDLLDDVSVHLKASKSGIDILPSLRTDSILNQSNGFTTWCETLSSQTKTKITDLDSYEGALQMRFEVFDKVGCKLADQALDAGFGFIATDRQKADILFKRLLTGMKLSKNEQVSLSSYLLCFIGKVCSERGWALQLHIGAQRKTSTRLNNLVGIAGGYAAIGGTTDMATLVSVLDAMDKKNQLPKTILYNLNPSDNEAFASLMGSFSQDGVACKIQLGPAWWYNDHYDGIAKQLSAISNYGLLHNNIGMTTDSRSYMSISRHEYFRRVFCQFISDRVKTGQLPQDLSILKSLVEDVCYRNAKNWLLNKN